MPVIHVYYHIWDINLTVQHYKHCMKLTYKSTWTNVDTANLNVFKIQDQPTSNNT